MSFEPILLAPQEQEKEIIPHRRVWRTTIIEVVILLVMVVVTLIVMRFYKGTLPPAQSAFIGLMFAISPAALWMTFSYGGERRALQPRPRMFTVALLGGLVANAIGIPLVERVFTVDVWLATASGTARILGFALTAGMIQEFLKYAVIRYSVWSSAIETRSDGIAYAMAASIGYATAVNLNYIFSTTIDPGSSALRIAEFTLSQLAIGTIMGYFLAELKLAKNQGMFWLPGGLILSALLTGVAMTVRGGMVVAAISPTASGSNPVQGLGVAIFLVIVLFSSFYFIINNEDQRSQLRNQPEFLR